MQSQEENFRLKYLLDVFTKIFDLRNNYFKHYFNNFIWGDKEISKI